MQESFQNLHKSHDKIKSHEFCQTRHPLARVPCFMTGDTATGQYDASPDAALTAVRAHKGPLLVDLDETLCLRNSTEDFIDCDRPGCRRCCCCGLADFPHPAFRPVSP